MVAVNLGAPPSPPLCAAWSVECLFVLVCVIASPSLSGRASEQEHLNVTQRILGGHNATRQLDLDLYLGVYAGEGGGEGRGRLCAEGSQIQRAE